MYKLYALHDYDKSKPGMFLIDPKDASVWNKKGYGIHWMPQVFKDDVRRMENLQKIRYWIADIDNGTKEQMMRRVVALPIQPTFIVETKRGFHVYWRAKDATAENYSLIERGISEFLCADGSLITPTHTLRFPGYYHMKDPRDPFLVKIVWQKPTNEYHESLMLRVFRPKPKVDISRRYTDVSLAEVVRPENWEKNFHVSEIMQGGRNNGLNKVAWKLKQMGADSGLVLQVLAEINQTLNPPLDYAEIRGIVRGKFK